MLKFIFICSFIFIACFDNCIIAQKGAEWMLERDIDVLETMNLEYRHPNGFKKNVIISEEMFCFDPKSKQCIANACFYPQLSIQKDRHFIIFFDTSDRIYTVEDSTEWSGIFPDGDFDFIDKQHIMNLQMHIECTRGKKDSELWKNYVTYYSEEDAKRLFNADTVITYSASLEKGYYFRKKYSHYKIYYLQRKGRGYIPIYCFFDKKAFKKQDKYTKIIDGLFWYNDEEPDWDMIKRKQNATPSVIIPYGTQKKQ